MLSSVTIFASSFILPVFSTLAGNTKAQNHTSKASGTNWNAPNQTQINDLNLVIDGVGVNGFIFNSSYASPGNDYYGGYNWCNMPHVDTQTYVRAPAEFTLEYVEVVSLTGRTPVFIS